MTVAFTELIERARLDDTTFNEHSHDEHLESARSFIIEQKEAIRRRHDAGESGSNVVRLISETADTVLRGVFSIGLHSVSNRRAVLSRVALCALGGYGRAHLNPHSDLDVCLLYEGTLDDNIEGLNSYLIHFLWDIGFKVGYGIRSVRDTKKLIEEDIKAFTGFLEGRLIGGDTTVFARLKLYVNQYQSTLANHSLVNVRIDERSAGLPERCQDLYTPEPSIKENAGGLRDFHTALWLLMMTHDIHRTDQAENQGLITPEDHLDLVNGLDFIWRVRNELHFKSNRADDELTFANQRHVAYAFGYATGDDPNVTRFMQDYYAAALRLRRFFRNVARICSEQPLSLEVPAEDTHQKDYVIEEGELFAGLNDRNWFSEHPVRLMEVFWLCARHGVKLSMPTERLLISNLHHINDTFRSSELVRRFFLAICRHPLQAGRILRYAARVGLLGRYIPEFAAVQGLMCYEDFHHFPVHEHTLRAIESLARLSEPSGPAETCLLGLLEHTSDPHILVLAILCHDLGKVAGEVHTEEGVHLAKQICQRIGVSEDDQDRVAFLVQHHLLMTHMSMYRDIDDEDIVRSFADTMQAGDRLRQLFLLSYADLSAVGPNVWNEWKGALLLKLYLRTEKLLSGKVETVDDEYWKSPKVDRAAAEASEGHRDKVCSHVRDLGERYLAAFTPGDIARHVALIAEAKASGLALYSNPSSETNEREVTICTRDCHALFSKIAGSFSSQLTSISSANLFTRPDGYVIDTFSVTDAHRHQPVTGKQIAAVEQLLRKVLLEGENVQDHVEKARRRLFALLEPPLPVPTRIHFDNGSSRTHTVIDIETGDRTGLLYDIVRAMSVAGLDISTARIVTDERRVRDSFYVTMDSTKIEDDGLQAEIREGIVDAIHPRPATK